MHKRYNWLLLSVLFFYSRGLAQTTSNNVMASEGKIYVVMAVCLVILLGLLAYLVSIDRKISKKEQSID